MSFFPLFLRVSIKLLSSTGLWNFMMEDEDLEEALERELGLLHDLSDEMLVQEELQGRIVSEDQIPFLQVCPKISTSCFPHSS